MGYILLITLIFTVEFLGMHLGLSLDQSCYSKNTGDWSEVAGCICPCWGLGGVAHPSVFKKKSVGEKLAKSIHCL
jgi:hypothetical protein